MEHCGQCDKEMEPDDWVECPECSQHFCCEACLTEHEDEE